MNLRIKVITTLLALIFLIVPTLRAQDLADPGNGEPYHPGLLHYHLGVYYQFRGDHQRAITEFGLTLEAQPDMGYAYAARGDSYAATGNLEQAIADYSEAIRIYPDYISALYTRGLAYHELGQAEAAMADFINAIKQMPEYAQPYWGLGDLYFEQGLYTNALVQYQTYLTLAGAAPEAKVLNSIAALATVVPTETLSQTALRIDSVPERGGAFPPSLGLTLALSSWLRGGVPS